MRLILLFTVLLRVGDGECKNCICLSSHCFFMLDTAVDFSQALQECQGRSAVLAALTSSQVGEAVGHLLGARKDVWVGLRRQDGGCDDPSSPMRGYRWTSGAPVTSYTNWASNGTGTSCPPSCASISRDLKWTERSCQGRVAGLVCETRNVHSKCSPSIYSHGQAVLHQLSTAGQCALDPGDVATLAATREKYVCGDAGAWVQGPWGCEYKNGGCQHECVSLAGAPQCVCPSGMRLEGNGLSCVETHDDPCSGAGCQHLCVPGKGCLCRPGYELRQDRRLCADVDECAERRACPGNMTCVNAPGSFVCHCPAGFTQQLWHCVDVDECADDPCEHDCENQPGTFTCTCREGYAPSPGDLHTCQLFCPHERCPAVCDPNDPNVCECPQGFVLDEDEGRNFCADIDECEMDSCDFICENTYGGFNCSCPPGFHLQPDNECARYPTLSPVPTSPGSSANVTPGALVGIVVALVAMVLVILFLLHLRRRSAGASPPGNHGNSQDTKVVQQATVKDPKALQMEHECNPPTDV